MAFTHTLGVTYKTDAGTITSTTDTYTADAELDIDDTVAASTTNKEFDLSVTIANVKSMVLYADQAVTVKTNSATSPQDTISLAAKKQLFWNIDSHDSIPFAGNLTKLFVTNSGGVAANFKVRFLANQGV